MSRSDCFIFSQSSKVIESKGGIRGVGGLRKGRRYEMVVL